MIEICDLLYCEMSLRRSLNKYTLWWVNCYEKYEGKFFHFKMLRAAGYVTAGCIFKTLEDLRDGNLVLLKYSSRILSVIS